MINCSLIVTHSWTVHVVFDAVLIAKAMTVIVFYDTLIIGNISCHSLLVKAASLQVIGENYCFIFFDFFSKRNLEKLDTVVLVEGNGTLVLNYFHRPCQASTLTIQRRDFLKTTLISK